jgi:DNA helicase-2/ATP-dependent DNA helicase PcrA
MRDRVAGFRVAQLLPGIGPGTAGRLIDRIVESGDAAGALAAFKPPAAAAAHWPDFEQTIGALRRNALGWPAELDAAVRWYEPHLERLHEDAAIRQADLAQLVDIAAGYPSRERFLTELTLDPPDATSGEAGTPLIDEDYLILSTIHSAKGQEWTSVFVLNTVDGCIPSDLAVGSTPEIEEERRLLYVAMTRAKDHLHLMVPQRFYVHHQRGNGDRHVYAPRTRFIPSALTRHFESRAWPSVKPASPAHTTAGIAVDVRAKLKRMWG